MGASFHGLGAVLALLSCSCGGRTELEVPGDACLGVSADCDGDLSNGCEADLDTSADHCGACGVVCESGLFCAEGACVEGSRVVQLESRIGTQFARTADGRVFAWGFNSVGQVDPLSDDEAIFTPHQVPLPVPSAEVKTSWARTCSRGQDGSVWCWGNRPGETLTKMDGLWGVTKLMGEAYGFCTFDAYRGQKCWTFANDAELSIATGNDRESTRPDVVYEMRALPRPLSDLLSSVAVVSGGPTLTWGDWLGTGRGTPEGELRAEIGVLDGVGDVDRIDSGDGTNFCATEHQGRIVCWGDGFDASPYLVAKPLFVDGPYKRAAIGAAVCALRIDGDLLCLQSESPWLRASNVAEVSSSYSNICIVTFDGRLMCQGGNAHGGLGQDPAVLKQSLELIEVVLPPDE